MCYLMLQSTEQNVCSTTHLWMDYSLIQGVYTNLRESEVEKKTIYIQQRDLEDKVHVPAVCSVYREDTSTILLTCVTQVYTSSVQI